MRGHEPGAPRQGTARLLVGIVGARGLPAAVAVLVLERERSQPGKDPRRRQDNRNFQSCLRIARRALAGTLKDPTGGATHYHAGGMTPPWAKDRKPSAEIGRHRFYNNVE